MVVLAFTGSHVGVRKSENSIDVLRHTKVASMVFPDDVSTRSSRKIVLTVTRQACLGTGAPASVVQLVESLVWPFVCKQSLKTVWFSDKDYHRFVNSMRLTAQRIILFVSEDNLEQTFIKFWLDSLLCKVFKSSEQPVRDPRITLPLFSGWCKRFCNRACVKRDLSFIYSLQKGSKKFWPQLGAVKEQMALDKHKSRLSTPRRSVPRDLCEEIQNTSRSIYGELLPKGDKFTKFMPTGSACLQASRAKGGSLSLFPAYDLSLSRKVSTVKLKSQFQFGSLEREERVVTEFKFSRGVLPDLVTSLEQWRNESYYIAETKVIGRLVPDSTGYPPALNVIVQTIPEPGKFRIITKGDGWLYALLQPLQGHLLSGWKKSMASTMLDNDLTNRVQAIENECAELPFWCSVDYEAATDLMKGRCTIEALKGLRNHRIYQFVRKLLRFNRAEYPDGTFIELKEGQLMGHPMSFPLLCIINLAVFRTAIRRWEDDVSSDLKGWVRRGQGRLMRQNVLVNGDDMLFKCRKSFYKVFVQTAGDAGFITSQGKQYLSPDCCMINSQTFRGIGPLAGPRTMKRFGYLNLQLIKGTSVKGGDSVATPVQIGKELSKMVEFCPWANCAIPTAFDRWKNDWFGPIYRPNWYLPVHLGGFGLDPLYAHHSFRVSRAQKCMAARFVSDPRMALYRRISGMKIPTVELAGALAQWRLVKEGDEGEGDISVSDKWLERLAYAARAHSDVTIPDKVFISRFKPDYRLKPMSWLTILEYWRANVLAFQPPPCPPFGAIKMRLLTSEKT